MTDLAEHLKTGASTVCRAWVARLRDGTVLGFTDHDGPLTVDGVVCDASSGLSAGALQRSTGMSVDNAQASGALSHGAITEDDLRAGRWDDAGITAYLVNWADPDVFQISFRGTIGEISWGDGAFSAELRGLAEALNRVRGRVYQGRCDAILGDDRCRLNLSDEIFGREVEVLAVEDDRVLYLPDLPLYADKWFERGLVTILDGPAAGAMERIKTDRPAGSRRRIELWSSLRRPLSEGARVRIEVGCDKRRDTCRFKFNNMLNFRGFPDVPGDDWLMAYPTSGAVNDGGQL